MQDCEKFPFLPEWKAIDDIGGCGKDCVDPLQVPFIKIICIYLSYKTGFFLNLKKKDRICIKKMSEHRTGKIAVGSRVQIGIRITKNLKYPQV